MNKDHLDPIRLARDVDITVERLERGWSYLSEEVDRWNTAFDFEKPDPMEPETFALIRDRVREFERTRALALSAGLGEHDIVGAALDRGKQLANDIREGRFLRLRRLLDRANRRHKASA